MNDQFNRAEEDELFGAPAPQEDNEVIEEPIEEGNDLSPEEFGHRDDDEYGFEDDHQETGNDDFLTKLLKSKNIDRNKIKVQNDDGTIEEISFDDLEDEDKIAILSEQADSPITDQEIADINYLRSNGINLADFAKMQREQAVKEYLAQNETPRYEVDSLNDDQLFVYDMMQRYNEELTDEEIDAELAREKENEELFAKKMNYLRTQYKAREDAEKNAAEQLQKDQFNAEKQELINSLTSAAININELQGVELENSDKEEILDFLLEEDAQGRTEFSKLLSNPEAIFKMAWFMKHGEEAFNTTVDYFKKELEKSRRGEDKQTRVIKKNNSKPKYDPYGLDLVFK